MSHRSPYLYMTRCYSYKSRQMVIGALEAIAQQVTARVYIYMHTLS